MAGDYFGQKRQLKNDIEKEDWNRTVSEALEHQSTKIVAEISKDVSWLHLWDSILDEGAEGTKALQVLFKVLTWPKFRNATCPICQQDLSQTDLPFISHCISTHLNNSLPSVSSLVSTLTQGAGRDIFIQSRKFSSLYHSSV